MTDTSLASLADLSSAISALSARFAHSIVSVHSRRSRSSGFVWRPGLIVTADEALPEEKEFEIASPANVAAANVVGRDPSTDVALLRVDGPDLTPVALASPAVGAGHVAITLGAEEGDSIVALGVIARASGPWRSLRGGHIDARIELDLRLQPNAQGGLAFNASAEPLGMVVFGARHRVLVIPSATIERAAAMLADHGYIPRGYLGLGLQPVTVEGDEGRGAMVMSVDPKGPGHAAGIQQGDVLMTWNDASLRDVRSLLQALGPDGIGKEVTFGLRRGGETRQVRLTIGQRASD
jgi:S1-C subfamily serine protease